MGSSAAVAPPGRYQKLTDDHAEDGGEESFIGDLQMRTDGGMDKIRDPSSHFRAPRSDVRSAFCSLF